MRLLENLPPPDDETYQLALTKILARADVLDAQAMVAVKKLVRLLQNEIVARISEQLAQGDAVTSWNIFWMPQLLAAVDQVIAEISERTGQSLADSFADAFKVGSQIVDRGVKGAMGLQIAGPILTPLTLTVVAPYSAELVRGVNDTARAQITEAIQTTIILGQSPHELMKKLTAPLTSRGTPANRIAYEAERIVRTELARVQDLASAARMRQAVMEFPDLASGPNGLMKAFCVVQRGMWPCKKCAPYNGNLYAINDPTAPEVPLHPNCRCCYVPHFKGLSTAIEPIVTRQEQASIVLQECDCCH